MISFTYIGGPTALLQWRGLRLITDPTFDAAGTAYPTGRYTLRKLAPPALEARSIGALDAVLLSHDHHFDNLDRAGRQFLEAAPIVLTTEAGAGRLGGRALGLAPWQYIQLPSPEGGMVRITATPARHGPAHADRGPVIGFALTGGDGSGPALWLSGDTVWYEGIEEVARRFDIGVAVLFMGAARVTEVGPDALTFTAAEAVQAARAMPNATIVPLHYEDWAHFSESRGEISARFSAAGLSERLRFPERGRAVLVDEAVPA